MTLVARTTREHFEKYSRLANLIGIEYLKSLVPADRDTLLTAFQKDRHLNNIPLQKWDGPYFERGKVEVCCECGQKKQKKHDPHFPVREMMARAKVSMSIADRVCVLKHVAVYHILECEFQPED